jgi:hypothetical protein
MMLAGISCCFGSVPNQDVQGYPLNVAGKKTEFVRVELAAKAGTLEKWSTKSNEVWEDVFCPDLLTTNPTRQIVKAMHSPIGNIFFVVRY